MTTIRSKIGLGFVPCSPIGRGFLTGAAQTDLAAGVHGDRASDLLWISQGRKSAAPHA